MIRLDVADATREVLYQGEMTRVYRQQGPAAGASIVCKEALGARAVERLRHERKILTRLAGIEGVPQLAAGAQPTDLLALQDEQGIALAQVLLGERLTLPELLSLALQLARTLAAVHRTGVIHKDINPANILLAGPRRRPLLIDFDLATTFSGEQPAFVHHGQITGTLAYISPEQSGRTGHSVDQRTDLYSLGVTLYELAVGHCPFTAQDPLQLIHDHLARLPVPPIALAPDLPPALSDIILRLLAKDPDLRYQSAEGLAHDLSRLIDAQARGDGVAFELGERDFALRLAPPSRLVGRDTEIAALQGAFEEALRGPRRGVLVAGAPGVGKTALINTSRPYVTARRGWFVSGKFDQLRQDLETDAVRQAMRALGRLLLAEPEAELVAQRERILRALGPNAGLITAMLPEFALLLGPQREVATSGPAEAANRLLQTAMELLGAIVSPERPLVMVLDDLQWAPAISIRFIDSVLTDESLRGLLLVGAYREAEVDVTHPLSAMLPRWERLGVAPLPLRLRNLPPAGLGTLMSEMLRLPAGPAALLAAAVGARTGGNPYDTVELVNALRRDGVLVPGSEGWVWDAVAIRRHIGQGNVVDLLSTRIARLPQEARALLGIMACLGGEVELGLLRAAAGLPATVLEQHLAPPLEDGLLVMEQGNCSVVRFRHDRVQQAAHEGLDPEQRRVLHLALARRLAALPEFGGAAAGQYLPAAGLVHEPDEQRRVAGLFQAAAAHARLSSIHAVAERFLAAAIAMLGGMLDKADEKMLAALEVEQHAELYSLGRLDEADALYRSIEQRCADPLDLVKPACVRVMSLTNRGRPDEALALGLSLLQRLGWAVPMEKEKIDAEVAWRLEAFYRWIKDADRLAVDFQRPEVSDPRVVAAANIINRTAPSAFFHGDPILAWLVLEGQRLWAEHGPCAALVGPVSYTPFITSALRQDYRGGHDAVRHVLMASEARGYEAQTPRARFWFVFSSDHWFEPLEDCVQQLHRAREGLLRGGDLQSACLTYAAAMIWLVDCAPTLERFAAEIEAGLAFAARTGDDNMSKRFIIYRQVVRALRGETEAPGSLADGSFDEAARIRSLGANPVADVFFHINRALTAAVFADMAGLARHAAAAMPLLRRIETFYSSALARLLQALALAQRLKAAAPDERAEMLGELDLCRDWLAQRATDAPANYLHLLRWIEAERAWAVDDFRGAACAFDAALVEVEPRSRPWHKALIAERAGLFYLAHGLAHAAEQLLARAWQLYAAWGASAKVRELEHTHPFLRMAHAARPVLNASINVSDDSIDMLGVLRASQALSSETSLERLKSSVVKLLGTMTGATTVCFVLQNEDPKQWQLCAISDQQMEPLAVEEAGALLPLSAFHYAERTREPLLVEDATHDDRFARDPYFAALERCSLLVIPILSKGVARAVLLLENQRSRGAFTADRLDAVMLIAGQLAVSLENALLYEQLEQRVRERTRDLHAAQAELVTTARQAGMAEIATNVLHNVGNVLNSVNVSAGLISSQMRASKVPGLGKVVQLMSEHAGSLGDFLTQDAKGKMLPDYLGKLAVALAAEQRGIVEELARLTQKIDHIKEIVATQQSYAGTVNLVEPVRIQDLVEDALRMNAGALTRHAVTVVREFSEVPMLPLDRHRVLQILINLISNAKQAMDGARGGARRMTLRVALADGENGRCLQVCVEDEGEGIAAENLARIFNHGFTTRKNGHGFGLHSCALAAREMGGALTARSDGPERGASFTLALPVKAEGIAS